MEMGLNEAHLKISCIYTKFFKKVGWINIFFIILLLHLLSGRVPT